MPRTIRILFRKNIVLLFIIFIFYNSGFAENYIVNNKDTDTVIFESTAKLEFLKGKTNNISGYFEFDSENPTPELSGLLRVDLRTLKTGIETRDGHMRERHLHTDKFPFAYFEIMSVDNFPNMILEDSLYDVSGNGYFYIHGVKRKMSPHLEFIISEDQIKLRAKFNIILDEYKIPRPKALFFKLAEVIKVEVIFTAVASETVSQIVLPDWSEIELSL